jgi:crossover junction endodeoxyribonuclease RuvC
MQWSLLWTKAKTIGPYRGSGPIGCLWRGIGVAGMIVIGIDIGLEGGIASINASSRAIRVDRMPVAVEAGAKRATDPRALARLMLAHLGTDPQALVVYEQVHAMPKQGVTSVFSFGRSRGAVEGVIAGLELPSLAVPPRRWKSDLGLTKDKDATRAIASRLLPQGAGLWTLKRDDGLAEAALLALWAMQRHCPGHVEASGISGSGGGSQRREGGGKAGRPRA